MKTETTTVAPALATELEAEKIFTFAKPIEFIAGEPYTFAHLREPTAAGWTEWADLAGVAADVRAVTVASGLPAPAIERARISDFRAMVDWIGRFFEDAACAFPPADMADGETDRVFPLRSAVTVGSGPGVQTFAELRLREPTVADWLQWDGLSGPLADIRAVSVVTGIPDAAVRKIGVRDLRFAAKWIGRFFVDAPATGAQS